MRAMPWLLLLVLTVGGGCRSAQRRGEDDVVQPRTTVRVENQRFEDMDIYAVHETQRIRLGTVNGNSTQILEIPKAMVTTTTELQFLASAIGGTDVPISDVITVNPGDQVGLIITSY